MLNYIRNHLFSVGLCLIWIGIWFLCQIYELAEPFCNRGFAALSGEYYRFFTALFLHSSFLHLMANVLALFFIGNYLECFVSAGKLLLFSLLVGTVAEFAFALTYQQSVTVGGSPVLFSLIGLILILQIMRADAPEFQMGTWYGNWIIGYVILSHTPLFSANLIATLLIHGFPLVFGMLLGSVCIWSKVI